MPKLDRLIRRKDVTGLAKNTWARLWPEPMPAGWGVHLVRKTAIQNIYGRQVCGVTLREHKMILIARNTGRPTFRTLVHELAHVRTIAEEIDHGPQWHHEFNAIACPTLGAELDTNI